MGQPPFEWDVNRVVSGGWKGRRRALIPRRGGLRAPASLFASRFRHGGGLASYGGRWCPLGWDGPCWIGEWSWLRVAVCLAIKVM